MQRIVRFLTFAVVALMTVSVTAQAQTTQLKAATYTCVDARADITVTLSTGMVRLSGYGCDNESVAGTIIEHFGLDYTMTAKLKRLVQRDEQFTVNPVGWAETNWIRIAVIAGGVIVGLILLFSNMYFVRQQEEFIVERFGKYARTQKAGLRLKIPLIETVAEQFQLRQQQTPVDCGTKTADNVFLKVKLEVQFRVVDSFKAFYELSDFQVQLVAYVFDEVRAAIPEMTFDEVFQKKETLAGQVRQSLATKMGTFGYQIVDVLVTDITPPDEIQAAMNQVVTQQRLRVAATEKGEAEKILVVKAAEAKKEQEKLYGEGVAAFRSAIANGTKAAMEAIKEGAKGLSDEEVSALLMATQYFDTMKEVAAASKANTIFLPSGPGASADVMTQMISALAAARRERPVVEAASKS